MTEIRDIRFSYGKRKILDGLSFTAAPGECVVLAGPNGSGKSTALSIIAGALRPDSGEVRPGGKVGYVPQGTALFEDMTAGENVRFFASLAGCPVPETLPFGVQSFLDKRVSKLSGGMKKQVSIACALLGGPRVLLLDEPCASLDVRYREELAVLIRALKSEGRTVIYAGHEPMELFPIYDRLVFLGGGTYSRAELPVEAAEFCAAFADIFRGAVNEG